MLKVSPVDACTFFAAYAVYLALGNTLLSITIKSGTITSYLADAAKIVDNGRKANNKRSLPDPRIDVTTGNTHAAITTVKKEVERWESMPNRRDPLTKGMIMRLAMQVKSFLLFSLFYVLMDWFVLGLYLGFRLTEYAQRKNVTSLRQVTKNRDGRPKALLQEDFEFFADNRRRLTHEQAIAAPTEVVTVDVRWRQQKNGQNGEKKTVHCNRRATTICPARASVRIIERASKLNLDTEHPVCVFTSNGKADGKIKFVTETHIADCLQNLAKLEYGITKATDLARYTSHSIRVGACVALHAAGLDKKDIQHQLRWRSTTFWNYLTQFANASTPLHGSHSRLQSNDRFRLTNRNNTVHDLSTQLHYTYIIPLRLISTNTWRFLNFPSFASLTLRAHGQAPGSTSYRLGSTPFECLHAVSITGQRRHG